MEFFCTPKVILERWLTGGGNLTPQEVRRFVELIVGDDSERLYQAEDFNCPSIRGNLPVGVEPGDWDLIYMNLRRIRDGVAESLKRRGAQIVGIEAIPRNIVHGKWHILKGGKVYKIKPSPITPHSPEGNFAAPDHPNVVPERILRSGSESVTIAPNLSGLMDLGEESWWNAPRAMCVY